ncbi:MAG: hypothetical protein NVSMB52_17380 [Chloroflexota bacterium]
MKWSTVDEAVSVVRSGQRVYIQGASAFLQALADTLTRRGSELHAGHSDSQTGEVEKEILRLRYESSESYSYGVKCEMEEVVPLCCV